MSKVVAPESSEVWPDHGLFEASGYSLTVTDVESIQVDAAGGADEILFHDSPGADRLTARLGATSFAGPGFSHTALGFETVRALATVGADRATLHDSIDNDRLAAQADRVELSGPAFSFLVEGFQAVAAYARNGGQDTAVLLGSLGNDLFTADLQSGYAKLVGDSFYHRVKGFETVEAYSNGGIGRALLLGTRGDDTFEGEKDFSRLRGGRFDVSVSGFAQVVAHARSTGSDLARLRDSELRDSFFGRLGASRIFDTDTNGSSYAITVRRFDEVHVRCETADDLNDVAQLWGTVWDDLFEAETNWGRYSTQQTDPDLLYELLGFASIRLQATPGGLDTVDALRPLAYGLVLDSGWIE